MSIQIYCILPRVIAGYNASILALRVVEGDEKEPGTRGYNSAGLSLGDINRDTWSSRLGAGRKFDELAL
jgi:hypothetical protein